MNRNLLRTLCAGLALFGALSPWGAAPAADAPAAAGPAFGPNRAGCSREQEAANKKIVEALVMPKPEVLLSLMHEDYIQHNPDSVRFMQINNVKGKAGMKLLLDAMYKVGIRPGPPPARPGQPPMVFPKPFVIAECDMITLVHEMPVPDPQNPGKTYVASSFDVYRIKDGKLYEHWDSARISVPPPAYLAAPFKELKEAPVPVAPPGPPPGPAPAAK